MLLLLLLLLLLLRAPLQASVTRSCKQLLLLAGARCCRCKRAYHRRQGSDLRGYDALLITVEQCLGRCCGAKTALLAWWLWRYEDYRLPSRFGRQKFGTRALSDFFISFVVVLLGRRRRGQRKNEGPDSSGCRAAHKIDHPYFCFLVLSASCCFCSLLLLHASAAAAAGRSCCCKTVVLVTVVLLLMS